MLPTLTLQLGEQTSFEIPSDSASLLPDGADLPAANFGEILRVNVSTEVEAEIDGGHYLPVSGNALPLLPADDVPEQPTGAEIAVSLESQLATPELETDGDTPLIVPDSPVDRELPVSVSAVADPVADELPALIPVDEDVVALGKNPRNGPYVPPDPFPGLPPKTHSEPGDTSSTPVLSQTTAPILPAIVRSAAELRDIQPNRNPSEVRAVAAASENKRPAPAIKLVHGGTDAPALNGFDSIEPAEIPATMTGRSTAPQATELQSGLQDSQQFSKVLQQTAAPTNTGGAHNATAATAIARVGNEPLATSAPPALTETISLPVQESGWDKMVSERVVLMAGNKLQTAEIRLTPAELGPLRIQLAMEDGAANVSFQAQHAMTREAIEQALPRLREMLAENGLTLGEANVSDEGVYQGTRDDAQDSPHSPGQAAGNDADQNEDQAAPIHTRVDRGLVDTFV